jgi:hypothetical protein
MPNATQIRSKVVDFPSHRVSHAVRDGATKLEIMRSRARTGFGRLLNKLGVPGMIRPVEFTDEITKQHIAVAVDDLFLRVSIDGRDYYFDRLTGHMDGTGGVPG